jgi:hypothetical protein
MVTLSGQEIPRGPIPHGSASIQGRVVDAESDQPLRDVVVRLGEYRSMRFSEVKTNADGVFEFNDIADGEYSVRASNKTHVPVCFGAPDQQQVACATVAVVRDQRRSDVDFRLTRGATIRGTVIDHDGRPAAGATVLPVPPIGGFALVSGNVGTANQDGAFELTNLPPAEMLLVVDAIRPPELPRLPSIYYPGVVRREDATLIHVTPGTLTTGITVVLPRVSENSLTAHVSSPAAVEGMTATLIGVTPRLVRHIRLSAEGTGTVNGLPEGRYFVWARARTADATVAAFDVVDLLHDSHELTLPLQPAGRITGRIVAQRGGLAPVDGVRVAAAWIHHGVDVDPLVPDQVEAGPDGYFSIDGLFGTRSLQLIGLSPEWQIQSVLQGRADVTSTGVDIIPGTTINLTVVVASR